MIFAHNHPSGVAEPSRADELLTQSLKQALALVDVRTLDHFVIAGSQLVSFAERGPCPIGGGSGSGAQRCAVSYVTAAKSLSANALRAWRAFADSPIGQAQQGVAVCARCMLFPIRRGNVNFEK